MPAYIHDYETPIDNRGRARPEFGDRTRVTFEKTRLPRPHDKDGNETGMEDEVDVAIITSPGDTQSAVAVRVTDEIKMRYPEQWLDYSEGRTQRVHGTPIEQLPGVNSQYGLQLRALNIATVEEMADVSDQNVKKLLGGIKLRQKARDFLATQPTQQDDKIAALEKQLAELRSLIQGGATSQVSPSAGKPQRQVLSASK